MGTHFVTGASGYLGRCLAQRLLKEPVRVIGFDVLPSPFSHENYMHIQGSLLDAPLLQKALQGSQVVYHCASAVPLVRSPRQFRDVNIAGTRNLLLALENEKPDYLLHVSSSSVYGLHPKAAQIDENAERRPIEAYGLSKKIAEDLVIKFSERTGVRTSVIRPRTIVGAGRLGLFELLFYWIHHHRTVFLPGRADHAFQLIHTEDLLNAMLALVANQSSGVFNVGNNHSESLREDLGQLIHHAQSRSKIVAVPDRPLQLMLKSLDRVGLSPFSPWQYLSFSTPHVLDTRNLKNMTGWRPQFSNAEALIHSYDGYLQNRQNESQTSIHQQALNLGPMRFLRWL